MKHVFLIPGASTRRDSLTKRQLHSLRVLRVGFTNFWKGLEWHETSIGDPVTNVRWHLLCTVAVVCANHGRVMSYPWKGLGDWNFNFIRPTLGLPTWNATLRFGFYHNVDFFQRNSISQVGRKICFSILTVALVQVVRTLCRTGYTRLQILNWIVN